MGARNVDRTPDADADESGTGDADADAGEYAGVLRPWLTGVCIKEFSWDDLDDLDDSSGFNIVFLRSTLSFCFLRLSRVGFRLVGKTSDAGVPSIE